MAYSISSNFSGIELPPVLYKYRNWSNADDRRLLTEGVAFFSSPKLWNRKDELNLPRDYESVTKKQLRSYFYKTAPKQGFYTRKEKRKIAIEMANKSDFHSIQHRNDTEEKFREVLLGEVTGFCTSLNKDNDALWKTFASSDSGFCVGFNFPLMFAQDFNLGRGGGGFIDYYSKKKLPKIRPFSLNDDDLQRVEDVMKLIFSLPDNYKRENEYRLIRMRIKESEVKFEPNSLIEIIVKEEMEESVFEEIKQIRDSKYPQSKILKAIFEEEYIRFEEIV